MTIEPIAVSRPGLAPACRHAVGLAGFGLLGEAFARRLRQAGMAVIAYDPSPLRRREVR
ncbi:NAD(P)-dependent oxidoreductase [Cupriavidus necator]|uniref:NAD(P)-dependent oxidoreductase n=1 Tax=Cupriavidus necator TaxID=106590 RepID=UPI00339D5C9E